MKNTLIIVGHPTYSTSATTKTICEEIKSSNEFRSGNIKIRNLIEIYPDYNIDIRAEQEALLWADIIVWQFPFYWYSTPGILKTWIDNVLEYGFAYGKTGDKLKGKHLILSTSTGGPKEAYTHGGKNNYEMNELFYPLKQTSNLIGTIWEEPIISHSMVNIQGAETDKTARAIKAIEHYNLLIETIRKIQ